jgi:RimJ/RimL family protein N-acetyltransferase
LNERRFRGWQIRAYKPFDRFALERMYADFEPKRAAQGLPPEGGRLHAWLGDVLRHGLHVVATFGPRVLGHVMLIPLENDSVELANFVHQSVRGRGLGTELNRAAIELARENRIRRIWLSVDPSNRSAIRSYTRTGFHILPGSPWAPELEMAIDLTSTDPQPDAALAAAVPAPAPH